VGKRVLTLPEALGSISSTKNKLKNKASFKYGCIQLSNHNKQSDSGVLETGSAGRPHPYTGSLKQTAEALDDPGWT
jgi:hypothetical protein